MLENNEIEKAHSVRLCDESRRSSLCHRCNANWKPGHRCTHDTTQRNVRHRLKNREYTIHIVLNIVDGLGEEMEDLTTPFSNLSGTSRKMDSIKEIDIYF